MEEQESGPRPVTAVVLIADEELRGRVVEVLADYFADLRAYERPMQWPSLGEILANRCYRTGRCFAHAVVYADAEDTFMSTCRLIDHQQRQGCRCLAERPGTRYMLLTRRFSPVDFEMVARVDPGDRFRRWGMRVDWSEPFPEAEIRTWADEVSRLPRLFPPEFAGLERSTARKLFMRCPYTGQVLGADSLQGLVHHFHALGHMLKTITVLKLREANWCDADGKSVPPPAELDRLRVAH